MLRTSFRKLLGVGHQQQNQKQSLVRLYHERVVDHYNNPRNVGSFEKNDPTVGTGLVGAPACGDVMKLQIKVDDESGKIVDACFKTFGCGSAIASSSVATEWVKGKQMEEVVTIKNTPGKPKEESVPTEHFFYPGGSSWLLGFDIKSVQKKRFYLGRMFDVNSK